MSDSWTEECGIASVFRGWKVTVVSLECKHSPTQSSTSGNFTVTFRRRAPRYSTDARYAPKLYCRCLGGHSDALEQKLAPVAPTFRMKESWRIALHGVRRLCINVDLFRQSLFDDIAAYMEGNAGTALLPNLAELVFVLSPLPAPHDAIVKIFAHPGLKSLALHGITSRELVNTDDAKKSVATDYARSVVAIAEELAVRAPNVEELKLSISGEVLPEHELATDNILSKIVRLFAQSVKAVELPESGFMHGVLSVLSCAPALEELRLLAETPWIKEDVKASWLVDSKGYLGVDADEGRWSRTKKHSLVGGIKMVTSLLRNTAFQSRKITHLGVKVFGGFEDAAVVDEGILSNWDANTLFMTLVPLAYEALTHLVVHFDGVFPEGNDALPMGPHWEAIQPLQQITQLTHLIVTSKGPANFEEDQLLELLKPLSSLQQFAMCHTPVWRRNARGAACSPWSPFTIRTIARAHALCPYIRRFALQIARTKDCVKFVKEGPLDAEGNRPRGKWQELDLGSSRPPYSSMPLDAFRPYLCEGGSLITSTPHHMYRGSSEDEYGNLRYDMYDRMDGWRRGFFYHASN